MIQIRQKMEDLDANGLWRYHLPRVGAAESAVKDTEGALKERLPDDYRDFLLHADGWPGFYQNVDLLSTSQLHDRQGMPHAYQQLDDLEPDVLKASGLRRQDLLPIAASTNDLDLFALARRSSPLPGTVIWFAGREIDRFPSFTDFFRSMIEYNKLEVDRLAKGGGAG